MRPDEWAEVAEACDADAQMAMVIGYSRLIWARFPPNWLFFRGTERPLMHEVSGGAVWVG